MTTVPLCFIDTETTGLHPDRRAWEIAIIRRESVTRDDGVVVAEGRTALIQVTDVDLSTAEPKGLQIGGFYDRHQAYAATKIKMGPWVLPTPDEVRAQVEARAAEDKPSLLTEAKAAVMVEKLTRGAHLVGVVPNFDAETLDPMLRRHRLIPAWHYHLVDVEAMAVGWLNAWASQPRWWVTAANTPQLLSPPWRSDDLSRACGVEPPSEEDRHTALGDARWAMRWYDAMTGGGNP